MESIIYYDAIGYLSIVFSLLSFYSKDISKMRILGALSATLFAISLYGYGGINGMFVCLLSVFVKVASLYTQKEQLKKLKYFSAFLALGFFFLAKSENILGILPFLSLLFTIHADTQTDIVKMKTVYYGSAIAWLIYAIFLGSVSAILYDILGIAVLTHSIFTIKKESESMKKHF